MKILLLKLYNYIRNCCQLAPFMVEGKILVQILLSLMMMQLKGMHCLKFGQIRFFFYVSSITSRPSELGYGRLNMELRRQIGQ